MKHEICFGWREKYGVDGMGWGMRRGHEEGWRGGGRDEEEGRRRRMNRLVRFCHLINTLTRF